MTNFSLPPEEELNNPVIEPKVKAYALKKMAELFRKWKKELNTKFVDKEKTPEYIGRYEKIRDHWPAFVAYKKSEKGKKRSEKNKKNAAKKKYHHHTGSGGYYKARRCGTKLSKTCLLKGSK